MLRKLFTAVLSLVFVACFAQSALALETTWFPSTIPVGLEARALGMGGACLAVTDARSYPANPAALVFLTDQGVFTGRFVNTEFDMTLGDQEYFYLCYAHPGVETNNAYSLTYYQNSFRWESILNLGSYTDNHLFYTRFLAIQYGYGHRFSDRISLGLNLRRVNTLDRYRLGGDYSSGVASIDAGAVFHPNKMMTVSVLITDVFAPDVSFVYEYDDDNDPSTPAKEVKVHYLTKTRILLGGAFRVGDLLLLAMDVDYSLGLSSDLMEAVRIGGEVHLGPVALRAGMYHGELTIGGGLKLGSRERDKLEINLDIAQTLPTSGVGSVQCMQLTVYF